MTKSEFVHRYPIHVRWGDADVFGHINNVQYMRYVESGRVAYCEDVFNAELTSTIKTGWILADMQCSYVQQVHYPAELEIYTRISQLGNKSATILSNIYREGEDEPVLTSRGVMVWFDFTQQKTAVIPLDIRDKAENFEKIAINSTS